MAIEKKSKKKLGALRSSKLGGHGKKVSSSSKSGAAVAAKGREKGGLRSDFKSQKKEIKKVKIVSKRKQEAQEGEDDQVDHFDQDGFFVVPDKLKVSQEDEKILEQFALNDQFIQLFNQAVDEDLSLKKEAEYHQNVLANPKIKVVYGDIAKLLSTYRSGQLVRAFRVIPNLQQWEEVLRLTRPEEWTLQAWLQATRCLTSGLDVFRSKIFFEKFLLVAVLKDIKKNKRLSYHLYHAVKKAIYKPAAFFKGLIFPLLFVILPGKNSVNIPAFLL